MRKIVGLMFACLASTVAGLYANPPDKTFEGEWASHRGLDFAIHLHQNGDQLTGYHSAVTKDGSRTDTVPDGEDSPSITGIIKGDNAIVDVHSGYSDALLKVRLTLHGRSLDWKVIEVKTPGEYYIPDKATLYKEHSDPKKR